MATEIAVCRYPVNANTSRTAGASWRGWSVACLDAVDAACSGCTKTLVVPLVAGTPYFILAVVGGVFASLITMDDATLDWQATAHHCPFPWPDKAP